MNYRITITALLGLALGVIFKSSPSRDSQSHDSPKSISTRKTTTPSQELPALSSNIQGNLTPTEILALPIGAQRTAEFTLWSLTASSTELSQYFDQALATKEGDKYTLDQIMTSWVRRFPNQALTHNKYTSQESRFWWAFGCTDPLRALSLVDHSDIENLSKVLRGIGNNDSDLALSLLDTFPSLNRIDAIGGIVEGLIETDPQRAIELLSINNHHDWQYLKSWTARDPQTAFSWLLDNNYLTSGKAPDALPNLIPLMMEKDPAFASAQIAALPTGQLKTKLLAAQAKELAKTNTEKALALADQHQGITRSHILASVVQSMAAQNPQDALALLEKIAPETTSTQFPLDLPDSESSVIIPSSTLDWSQPWVTILLRENPEAVMQVVTNTSSSSNQTYKTFFNWSRLDSSASLDWLINQPEESTLKHLFDRLSRNLNYIPNNDFSRLLNLSSSIDSDQSNDIRIISAWKNTAPTEAAHFFESGKGTAAQQEIAREILDLE